MNRLLISSAFVSVCLTSAAVLADEVDTPPVTVTLEYDRPRGGNSKVWNKAYALEQLNAGIARKLGDVYGWSGLGKLRLKLTCSAPRTLKGIPASGFTWTRTNNSNPEKYTGTITKFRCE
jgi:hypothetical protein